MNVLLRVIQPVPPVVIEGSRHVVVEDVEARRIDAEEYLAPLAVELRDKACASSHARRGQPADEIIAAAREMGADLIAIHHGRGGLGRLVFGPSPRPCCATSRRPYS
jgi:nucleotide-binding universal stress UspA family protein